MRELGGDLDSAEEVDPELLRFVGGFGAASDGVVVGEGEGAQVALLREVDNFARCQRAVGCSGVAMEINKSFGKQNLLLRR